MSRKLYRCAWPNGDVSLVYAGNIEDAIWLLDEVAEALPEMITEVREALILNLAAAEWVGPTEELDDDADAGDFHCPWVLESTNELALAHDGPLAMELARVTARGEKPAASWSDDE